MFFMFVVLRYARVVGSLRDDEASEAELMARLFEQIYSELPGRRP